MKKRPPFCNFCGKESIYLPNSHWYWIKDNRYKANGKWRCIEAKKESGKRYRIKLSQDNIRKQKARDYQNRYAKKHPNKRKYKAYKHFDNKKGFLDTLKLKDALALMIQECFYCNVYPSSGLDRRDSKLGHNRNNVVSCCEKCNIILGDLPIKAKDILRPGLIIIRQRNILNEWEIPTKRGRKCSSLN